MFEQAPHLQAYAVKAFAAIQAEMKSVLSYRDGQPIDDLHAMMQYHMGWLDANNKPVAEYGGKQIRPLLCLLVAEAAGGAFGQAIPAGAAIELLHNFSLIHDDIEDNSPTRRGRDTLWSIWGIPLAINAGDAMFAAAHLGMARLVDRGVPAEVAFTALRRFDETCLHLTQGQHLDMSFETMSVVETEAYIEMITGKTSVLIQLCAELGARIAGQSEEMVAHYANYGLNVGLAFQVLDDILGIWGEEEKIGKSASTDILTKKKTLPVLYGLNHSETLRGWYAEEIDNEAEFVHNVTAELEKVGALEYSRRVSEEYTGYALSALEAADPQGDAGQAIYQITDFLLQRQH